MLTCSTTTNPCTVFAAHPTFKAERPDMANELRIGVGPTSDKDRSSRFLNVRTWRNPHRFVVRKRHSG